MIDVDSLQGDEFKMLKDYKKFEMRKHMLNNFNDSMPSDQDLHPVDSRNPPINATVGNTSMMSIDDSSREQINARQIR